MPKKTPHEKWQIWQDPEAALRRRDSLVERQIREAMEAGKFDNLPGMGKPLPKDPSEDLTPDRWMANRVLKQSGFVPEWIELRKQIAAERPAVAEALATYRERAANVDRKDPSARAELEALEQRYIELATEINAKIDRHNGECPRGQILTRFVEDATRRW